MLIISRKAGESFLIGDDIEIVILDVQNDKIRVGIEAPKNVKILRTELYETEKANHESVALADRNSLLAVKKVLIKKL